MPERLQWHSRWIEADPITQPKGLDVPVKVAYQDFSVSIREDGAGRFEATAAEGAANYFDSPFKPEELDNLLENLEAARGTSMELKHARKIGKRLFRGLFSGTLKEHLRWRIDHIEVENQEQANRDSDLRKGLCLRLAFRLQPESSEWLDARANAHCELASLPWELLYWPDRRRFLGDAAIVQVVRELQTGRAAHERQTRSVLRVLLVAANPEGTPPLNLKVEVAAIQSIFQRSPRIDFTFVGDASFQNVAWHLQQYKPHVLHFMGHGAFIDEAEKEVGAIVLQSEKGEPDLIPAETLASLLRQSLTLQLVVLNACDSARIPRRRGADPFAGVSSAILMQGVPAVAAMQFAISNQASKLFAKRFYESLVSGESMEQAMGAARQAMWASEHQSVEWAAPVLFHNAGNRRLLKTEGIEQLQVPEEKESSQLGRPDAAAPPVIVVPAQDRIFSAVLSGLVAFLIGILANLTTTWLRQGSFDIEPATLAWLAAITAIAVLLGALKPGWATVLGRPLRLMKRHLVLCVAVLMTLLGVLLGAWFLQVGMAPASLEVEAFDKRFRISGSCTPGENWYLVSIQRQGDLNYFRKLKRIALHEFTAEGTFEFLIELPAEAQKVALAEAGPVAKERLVFEFSGGLIPEQHLPDLKIFATVETTNLQ